MVKNKLFLIFNLIVVFGVGVEVWVEGVGELVMGEIIGLLLLLLLLLGLLCLDRIIRWIFLFLV